VVNEKSITVSSETNGIRHLPKVVNFTSPSRRPTAITVGTPSRDTILYSSTSSTQLLMSFAMTAFIIIFYFMHCNIGNMNFIQSNFIRFRGLPERKHPFGGGGFGRLQIFICLDAMTPNGL